MQDEMSQHGLKEPQFDVSENFFYVTFYGHTRDEMINFSNGMNDL